VVRERVGRDVVGLDKGGIKQIAERDRITRLETDEVLASADKRFGRDGRQLIQITRMFFGPVEHDHGGRNFRQTADLAFLAWLLLIQNNAGVGIDDCVGPSGVSDAGRQAKRQRKKSDEKAAWNSHGKVKSLHLNRCDLVGNRL
jgi:hypothetical protein